MRDVGANYDGMPLADGWSSSVLLSGCDSSAMRYDMLAKPRCVGLRVLDSLEAAKMSDQPATRPGGPVFDPTPTADMWQPQGSSQTPLPASIAEHLQPAEREGDVGTFQGWPIVRLLGRGGMAVVLHGYDKKLRRDVAIKMIHPDRLDDPQMAARFAREARLTAQVNHPHVITVYSVHDESDQAFIVMEYLHGGTLQERLQDRPVSEEECIRIARDIALGLQAAHEVGLLHRDLKPSNIGFRQPGGHVVIMDFGLARTLCDTDPLTIHGSPLGTPAFMSPEQIQVQKLDHRTDLFSLGTVMYRMLSGHHPFQGSSPAVLCHAIACSPATPLRQHVPDVSPELEAIVNRLLQKSPAQRFQTAAQLIEALDGLSQPAKPKQHHWLATAAILAVPLIAIGAYLAPRLVNSQRETQPGSVAVSADSPAETQVSVVPISEFRDANGVVWRSTNREHAGIVSVDADGVVRLEKPADQADRWTMVEGDLEGPSPIRRYLLLDVVELSAGGDVSWAAKIAPPEGSNRDVELNYGHEAGQFAFLLPEELREDGGSLRVRVFLVGPGGTFVRFRDVWTVNAVPEGFRELPVLSAD